MGNVAESRAGRWARRQLERLLGAWSEGPQPPRRFLDAVGEFALQKPSPTRKQWARFAAHHALLAYRQGYLRGYEHAERDPDWFRRLDPDRYADKIDPSWRERAPFSDEKPDPAPRDDLDEKALERALGRHKEAS